MLLNLIIIFAVIYLLLLFVIYPFLIVFPKITGYIILIPGLLLLLTGLFLLPLTFGIPLIGLGGFLLIFAILLIIKDLTKPSGLVGIILIGFSLLALTIMAKVFHPITIVSVLLLIFGIKLWLLQGRG